MEGPRETRCVGSVVFRDAAVQRAPASSLGASGGATKMRSQDCRISGAGTHSRGIERDRDGWETIGWRRDLTVTAADFPGWVRCFGVFDEAAVWFGLEGQPLAHR